MSSLTRWDPIREMTTLHDAVSQLFDQAVLRPGIGTAALTGGSVSGMMNVIEANGRYYCQFIVPGVTSDDIDLTVRQNTLTLKARVREPFSEDVRKQATYLLHEFGAGEFTRSITFPKDIDANNLQAHFENGILMIEAPLSQHAQERRITITSGGAAKQPMVESSTPSSAQLEAAQEPAKMNGKQVNTAS